MNNQDYEKIITEQKYYIQVLESMLNRAYVELANQKNIFEKTDQKIEKLNNDIDNLLSFVLNNEITKEKNPMSLQEYLKSFNFKTEKNLIFGINIEQKFIKESSIPTLQYYLYKNNCFLQKKFSLYGLIPKNKKDLITIGQTFHKYIELCFKKKQEEIIGICYISTIEEQIYIDYYGNQDIELEFEDFIKLYTKEESLENLLL
ncbi:hypothetical protein [Helicobacter anatolicus]|uniref:hypothetical protein n=1 Tax=Helicobacter anatolicus TaxID=2905874 RepID=UPI001E5DC837|nr:hypothetical protein [Helicobacter anatolicus]MCE3038704.1 hypothetical protein [Helicobacter anatolicus]